MFLRPEDSVLEGGSAGVGGAGSGGFAGSVIHKAVGFRCRIFLTQSRKAAKVPNDSMRPRPPTVAVSGWLRHHSLCKGVRGASFQRQRRHGLARNLTQPLNREEASGREWEQKCRSKPCQSSHSTTVTARAPKGALVPLRKLRGAHKFYQPSADIDSK